MKKCEMCIYWLYKSKLFSINIKRIKNIHLLLVDLIKIKAYDTVSFTKKESLREHKY